MDIHALRRRAWSISAIARHVGKDRRTVRAYLDGKRQVGVRRAPAGADTFAAYAAYCTARLAEDPHLWATALFDEVTRVGSGFAGGGEHLQAAGAVFADQVDHRPAGVPEPGGGLGVGQAVDEERAESFVAAVVDLAGGGEEVRAQRWSWCGIRSRALW